MTLDRGQILAGKYLVERTLGEGGFGIVLEATHLVLGERVAIKVLKAELARDEVVVARFLREARAAARIRGEHVARVLDVGSSPGEPPYIVMEHLVGNDLGKLVATRGALPVATAIDHILQACTALAEAHALGIVHRDVKPSNLFLTTRPDGTPSLKVLDFGIAKAAPTSDAAPSFTRTQDVVGTPLYMAPEQMRSAKVVDRRTDVWALGATLYELLAGKPAFDGATVSDIYAMVLTESPAPLDVSVPAPVAAAIACCLEKTAERRFPDVTSFAAAIAPFGTGRVGAPTVGAMTAGSLPPASLPVTTLPQTVLAQRHTLALSPIATAPRARTRRGALLALLALAAVVGAAIAVYPRARVGAASRPAPAPAPTAAPDATVAEVASEPAPTPETAAPAAVVTELQARATTPASAKQRQTKSRKQPEAKLEPKPEVDPEPSAPAASSPRGVATSRFE
ncbi:MAG: serine/threonine protein kinase [Labilithrix sp.]|nr:serine/threonine protein kinase [Labilithrix sp.]MCW5812927.1 serine/threonine protein kinase [Labilithrix sp.]